MNSFCLNSLMIDCIWFLENTRRCFLVAPLLTSLQTELSYMGWINLSTPRTIVPCLCKAQRVLLTSAQYFLSLFCRHVVAQIEGSVCTNCKILYLHRNMSTEYTLRLRDSSQSFSILGALKTKQYIVLLSIN